MSYDTDAIRAVARSHEGVCCCSATVGHLMRALDEIDRLGGVLAHPAGSTVDDSPGRLVSPPRPWGSAPRRPVGGVFDYTTYEDPL